MAAHNYDWARTGHLPAFKAVLASERFRALPQRANIAPLGTIGRALPGTVQRQSAVEGIVGEEMSAAITGQKSSARALSDADRRVNEFLAELQ
jgi:multiple sugar transport system substrate-binding protein